MSKKCKEGKTEEAKGGWGSEEQGRERKESGKQGRKEQARGGLGWGEKGRGCRRLDTVGREIGKTIGMATIDGIAITLSPSVPLTSEKWSINLWKGKF